MPSIKVWLSAARLRTLPLSISGIIVGAGLALQEGLFNWETFSLALLATLGFQILSNFANDYGDGVKGTDNENRVGPARTMQSGLLTAKQLKRGMYLVAIATLVIVVLLIYVSFGKGEIFLSLLFLLLGIGAIVSAIKYTVGKSAYGYRGLGDIFVFIFFGLVGVCGSFYLFAQFLSIYQILAGFTIGSLSTMVLHLNNMRDRVEDQKVSKRTFAVLLGKRNSMTYHFILYLISLLSWLSYLLLTGIDLLSYISLLAFIPITMHLKRVYTISSHEMLDPELKKVALSTFLLAVLFYVGCYL